MNQPPTFHSINCACGNQLQLNSENESEEVECPSCGCTFRMNRSKSISSVNEPPPLPAPPFVEPEIFPEIQQEGDIVDSKTIPPTDLLPTKLKRNNDGKIPKSAASSKQYYYEDTDEGLIHGPISGADAIELIENGALVSTYRITFDRKNWIFAGGEFSDVFQELENRSRQYFLRMLATSFVLMFIGVLVVFLLTGFELTAGWRGYALNLLIAGIWYFTDANLKQKLPFISTGFRIAYFASSILAFGVCLFVLGVLGLGVLFPTPG